VGVAVVPGEPCLRVGPDDLPQPDPVAAVAGVRGTGVQVVGGGALEDDGVVAGDQVADALAVGEPGAGVVHAGGEVVEQCLRGQRVESGDDEFGVVAYFTDRIGVGVDTELGKYVTNATGKSRRRTRWYALPGAAVNVRSCGVAGVSTLARMAIQVVGRRPHRPEDAGARAIVDRTAALIGPMFVSEFDRADGALLGSYGLRMVVLAVRERSLDRLQHGLLAMALGAAVRMDDERDLMIGLAVPHVAAVQLGARPVEVFETAAGRFEDGWVPGLLRVFGTRTDVTLAAFGWRQIMTIDGFDIVVG